jgi:glycosyltransferase involved in cell wall biosynthesis
MASGAGPAVLMTADTVGGVWTYAVALAEALATCGVRVVLATMGEPLRGPQRAMARRVPSIEIVESRFKLEWMDDPWDDVERAGEWLLDLARCLAPDVVHLNGYVHAALPWQRPLVVVAHSCVLSWWRAVLGEEAPERYEEYRARVAAGIAQADVVVAPSAAMADAIAAHYGPARALRVIANGADAARFAPGDKEPLILAAGRLWDPAKNLATLDAAARGLSWPVVVAGSVVGPDGVAVPPRYARSLGWIGEREVAAWMARASIYAHPARYEPFGLSVLEAALAGCALVLGDVPSLRELWGDTAIFVPPDDVAALRGALAFLARDPHRREALARRARARALAYSPERMRDGYIEVYAEAGRTVHEEARPCA